jgi:LysM repeat protein
MKIKIKKPKLKIKLKAPTIKVGKDLGMKNIGKAASSAVSSVGKTTGDALKIAESGLKAQGKLLTGDFKGAGKEALQGFTSAGNIAGEIGGNVGGLVGDRKTGDIAGRITADVGANAITGGGYGLAKTAAQGLSSGGVGGLLSSKGLQEAALGAAGSYAGIDPNLIKAGLSATQGDIKGAALSGLSSLGGFDPKQLQMASTGVSALTGDKKGLASGLASQFGASDSAANMLGSVAGGDIKGALLGKLAGATGLDQKMLENVSKGKFDPMQLAAAGGLDSSSLLGGAADKLGISSFTKSPEAQEMINMGKSAGRSLASVEKNIQEAKSTAEDTYKIAKGDSFNAIAKKMGVTPEQLKAANPQIKDINKIASGANLNIPKAASQAVEGARQNVTDKYLKDAQGRTIYGANNAPIANPNFSAEEYDKAQAQRADLAEDAAAYVPGQQLGEEKWTMDRVLGNIKREGGKALDTIKTGAGAVGGAIGGALSSAKDFAAENKGALGLAADAAAAYGGYRAGQEASEKVEDLSKQQLRDLQAQGKTFEGITYDPERYKQQRQFLQESIAGGGRSALTRQLAAESDREAGAAEAAARGAALQKAAEIGG